MELPWKRTTSTSDSSVDAGSGDVAGHLRRLRTVAPLALVIALLAGAITFTIIHTADTRFEVTATAQIDAQIPVVSGDSYLFQNSAPYLALASSGEVHRQVAERMGDGWTAAMVGDDTSVAVSKSPLLLEVTASAPTPEAAVSLSRATIDVLDEASRAQRSAELDRAVESQTQQREQLEAQIARTSPTDPARQTLRLRLQDIQGQINRILDGGVNGLSALSIPDAADAVQTSPRSPALALFVALATFVISAEILVFATDRLGRGVTAGFARRVGKGRGIAVEQVAPGTAPPVTHALIARYRDNGERTLLLTTHLSDHAAAAIRHELPDATVSLPFAKAWPTALDESVAQVVIIVCDGERVRSELRNAADVIRELGVAGRIVIVTHSPHAEDLRDAAGESDTPTVDHDDVPDGDSVVPSPVIDSGNEDTTPTSTDPDETISTPDTRQSTLRSRRSDTWAPGDKAPVKDHTDAHSDARASR